jgi:hypothetical protein
MFASARVTWEKSGARATTLIVAGPQKAKPATPLYRSRGCLGLHHADVTCSFMLSAADARPGIRISGRSYLLQPSRTAASY